MPKRIIRRGRSVALLVSVVLIMLGGFALLFSAVPQFRSAVKEGWWDLARKGKRLLGWGRLEILPEEKRIREEVILKKMEEASANRNWVALVPEYPQAKKWQDMTEEERSKAIKESAEFKQIEKSLLEYLNEREILALPEHPMPSPKEAWEFPPRKDKATEKIIEGLVSSRKRPSAAKPLEENVKLGINGPVAARQILERPPPPKIKVHVETEIELTFWVLPNGMVDRAIPSVKGDAELERLAIQYLKQWRFAPLPKDEPQIEEWGTIPIRFKFQ